MYPPQATLVVDGAFGRPEVARIRVIHIVDIHDSLVAAMQNPQRAPQLIGASGHGTHGYPILTAGLA